MMKMTNAQADQVAREVEDAAQLLRSLVAYHHRQADAMGLIDEQLMSTYHQAQVVICRGVVDNLTQIAAAMRAREPRPAPAAPSGRTPARHRPGPSASISDYRRRQAIANPTL